MRYMDLCFTFVARGDIAFPENPVNTVRGALGYQLKQLACAQKRGGSLNTICKGCDFEEKCGYALCYETSQRHMPEWFKELGSDVPNLMIIEAGFEGNKTFDAGESFQFLIRLFGQAINSVGYLILAAQRAGSGGLTKDRVVCDMQKIIDPTTEALVWNCEKDSLKIPEPSRLELTHPNLQEQETGEIKLSFVTPVAFKDRETGRISEKPDFGRLIGSLVRRYTVFEASEGRRVDWKFKEITALARNVKLSDLQVKPAYWERFSTKQNKRIPISGVVGEATYEGPVKPFVELLNAASLIRCGRSVAFGQGNVKIQVNEEN